MKSLAQKIVVFLACAICSYAQGNAADAPFASQASQVAAPTSDSTVAAQNLAASADSTSPADTSFKFTHDNVFTIIGVIFTHHALRNSETLHDWPFFAIAAPAVSSTYKLEKNFGKKLGIKSDGAASLTPMNLGISASASVSLFHLLELGIKGTASSAWNYGKTSTFMGVYNPDKRNFDQDIFFTEGSFGVTYKANLTIPLLAFLPKSKWTKIILKGGANFENSFYTGAKDGEPWKAGADIRINGFRSEFSGTLIYMLPFKHVNMAMLTVKASGFIHEGDFDEIYKDYDPDFKTWSITPRVMFKINDKWSGIAMAPIARERKFDKSSYESNEELMLRKVGTEWRLKSVMCMLNRKF